MSDVDTDDGTELESGDEQVADFMGFLADEDMLPDGDDEDDESDAESDDPGTAGADDDTARVVENDGNSEEPEGEDDGARAKGRERLAGKLSAKERELTVANRRIKELEVQLSGRTGEDPDLIEDRVNYVRAQIARGLGLKPDSPRVSEELRELLDDLVLGDVTPEMLNDPKNEALRRQVEERRTRNAGRKDRIAVDRKFAELERREAQAAAVQVEQRVRGQLDGYLRSRAEEVPFLSENPDGHPVELVYRGLQLRLEEGHDLSTDAAMVAAVEEIVEAYEKHYAGVAEKLAAIKAKRDAAATAIANPSAKRQGGAASGPKRRTGGRTDAVKTVTASKGNGGRGAAPSHKAADDDESFDEFATRVLNETQAAKRGRR